MPTKKQRIDSEFTRLLGNHMVNAKGFFDYGVKRGLTTPEALRLTVAKRKETAKALTEGGMSQRKVAKVLGVHHKTIQRDVAAPKRSNGAKSAKSGAKSATKENGEDRKVAPVVTTQEAVKVTSSTLLQSLFKQADANGGVIYVEVNGYGVRVKKLTC